MELPLSSPAKCELRSVILFLSAKNNSPVEIHRQLVEVYGEKCMDIKNVRKWCREFNEGRINVHDEQRSGRSSLSESTVARIDEMVRANRRITLEEIEDGLNEDFSHFSVHKIVSNTLGYRKVSARWVDKCLKEAAGEWYNTGITKLVDRMKKRFMKTSEALHWTRKQQKIDMDPEEQLYTPNDANTLRTSALALIFSTAEYCAPVWEGSCHTKLIDTQLNSTLRIITGVCQPTRIDWLPVLAHISPPELRRNEATKKMYQKLLDSPDLEINPILQSPPKHRLKSRNPIWSRGNQLLSQNFNISEAWTNSWISSDIPNKNLITSPSVKIPGLSLPRREWVLLNRFRTGQGRCAELMKLWGYTKDPNCACNVPQSMSHILDDCPLYKFNGGISNLHSVTPEALNWLKALPLRL
ncbi:hypothetical protein LAZ67_5003531 [Cordylochernes scorpioides]|uniref:Mos1 transposase HTH domain-containing protein n=1 Tax=Cordylochernes scorpioides TaxID=51811 RepID=A0ABY6KHB2_9ARAC|nr:hypothetical protein LAZ67_5003531 [Cordylochernes scorpioides]